MDDAVAVALVERAEGVVRRDWPRLAPRPRLEPAASADVRERGEQRNLDPARAARGNGVNDRPLPRVRFRERCNCHQQVIQRVERLHDHLDVGQHRHEVGVAVPARHDVPVQVARQPGPGDPAQVQADVVAVRRASTRPARRPCAAASPAFPAVRRRQFVEPALVGARRDEQMAVVVREAVEHHDAARRPQGDQVGAVVVVGQAPADEAAGSPRRLRRRCAT